MPIIMHITKYTTGFFILSANEGKRYECDALPHGLKHCQATHKTSPGLLRWLQSKYQEAGSGGIWCGFILTHCGQVT